jgi:UDP-N-acetylmuramate dehydrogenase
LDYGAIKDELNKMQVEKPSIKSVSDAIVRIRSSKLPDPAIIGNAGSFFKNPVVSQKILDAIKLKYQDIVFNKVEEGYKLAAGWLIERAGWKGWRDGDAGVHAKQALVLVNYGNAKGGQILALANKIQASVFDTFGIALEMEVNVIQ